MEGVKGKIEDCFQKVEEADKRWKVEEKLEEQS